mmetsp:Transcript_28853/g.95816  ORF Transcript_28853/g.95816 Transcript_28853/m.95816 type:complete len:228 (+) Transcript_28853:174-857(+)
MSGEHNRVVVAPIERKRLVHAVKLVGAVPLEAHLAHRDGGLAVLGLAGRCDLIVECFIVPAGREVAGAPTIVLDGEPVLVELGVGRRELLLCSARDFEAVGADEVAQCARQLDSVSVGSGREGRFEENLAIVVVCPLQSIGRHAVSGDASLGRRVCARPTVRCAPSTPIRARDGRHGVSKGGNGTVHFLLGDAPATGARTECADGGDRDGKKEALEARHGVYAPRGE